MHTITLNADQLAFFIITLPYACFFVTLSTYYMLRALKRAL
jgi:hypothetical protein